VVFIFHRCINVPSETSPSLSTPSKLNRLTRYIQWIGHSPVHDSPVKASVRFYHSLFLLDDPDAHPNGFLGAVNPHSEQVFPNALVEVGFGEISRRAPWPSEAGEEDTWPGGARPESVRFQGTRTAYYCVDQQSTSASIILNRIVSLKEESGKN